MITRCNRLLTVAHDLYFQANEFFAQVEHLLPFEGIVWRMVYFTYNTPYQQILPICSVTGWMVLIRRIKLEYTLLSQLYVRLVCYIRAMASDLAQRSSYAGNRPSSWDPEKACLMWCLCRVCFHWGRWPRRPKPEECVWFLVLYVTRILSGRYGARTLAGTVHFIPCIKIGDKFFMKKTLKFLRLLLSGPYRVYVIPWHYKVCYDFLSRSTAETKKFFRICSKSVEFFPLIHK
jgi:hypothetical protein